MTPFDRNILHPQVLIVDKSVTLETKRRRLEVANMDSDIQIDDSLYR